MVSLRVVRMSSGEYKMYDWAFQLKRLENQPLNSPTTGDKSGEGEPSVGDVRLDKVDRLVFRRGCCRLRVVAEQAQ
jgi:hypothetical protein